MDTPSHVPSHVRAYQNTHVYLVGSHHYDMVGALTEVGMNGHRLQERNVCKSVY